MSWRSSTIVNALECNEHDEGTPGATLIDAGAPATPMLAVLSSNLLQEPSGSRQFQQWLAEVQNNGPR